MEYKASLVVVANGSGSLVHPISGEGVGYAMESGRLAASFAHEAHARGDFSASVLSGYEKQLRKQRAREQLSGYAFANLVPNMEVLEPLFKVSEKDPTARQTTVEIFTGHTPIYGLLRHPKVIATALRDAVRPLVGGR